ncbi:MAG: class I SAM-dependent methyltransferase [Candidatus Paceibacterota bacterium]
MFQQTPDPSLGLSINSKSLMLPEELDALFNLVPKEGVVLEIGTFHGATVAQLAIRNPGVLFYSVDPLFWKRAGLKWYENRQPNMRLLTGTSADLMVLKTGRVFDLIIVDGDHSYDACYNDLKASEKLIKSGCPIAVHDYARGTLRKTLARAVVHAVNHFCRVRRYKIREIVGTMAILEVNNDQNDPKREPDRNE